MPLKHLWVFDRNKLRILNALYSCQDTLCGCDLVGKLDIPKNLLSHHLKTLKDKGFISETKCGRRRQYRLDPQALPKIEKILAAVEAINI